MADTYFSMRNVQFVLYEVMKAEGLCALPRFEEHSREIFDMVLETGKKLCDGTLYPALKEMDLSAPAFKDGRVTVSPVVRELMRECSEGGWIGAHADFEQGGQQLPDTVLAALRFMFSASNYSASVYPFLSSGAAQLILSFGSPELADTYVPPIFEGRWQGTMAMTEPHAGSSLADLQTTARRTDGDYFLLTGQKIFISCGEHDGVENIVHLMLARIEGAPAGVKGISLFVVPKLRPDGQGGLVPNDVVCTGIFHKLGYRGSPITQLEMGEHGDCRAWLVGQEHQGLRYMFQMMNEARVGVGMGATAIATAAYYASLKYSMERCQGRPIGGKDLSAPQVPIIEHADVKRMLLFQRSIVEGSLSLIVYCSKLIDLIHAGPVEDRERHELLLDFLTPIAKSYPSEMGILSASAGLQCLGGYGYCDEFPLEQYYRDARIHPIHEGTTGIQGLDLLGRKVTMHNGAAYRAFIAAVESALAEAGDVEMLGEACTALRDSVGLLNEVTEALLKAAASGETEAFLADATLYLELTSLVAIGWHWILQGTVAERALAAAPDSPDRHFYLGKRDAYTYFMRYELPKMHGLAARLKQCDGFTARVDVRNFEGA